MKDGLSFSDLTEKQKKELKKKLPSSRKTAQKLNLYRLDTSSNDLKKTYLLHRTKISLNPHWTKTSLSCRNLF